MPVVLPNEGLADQLGYWIRDTISGVSNWELMLFVNDITPDQDTVYGDLTECTLTGYSRVELGRGDWTAPALDGDLAVSTYTETPQTWTFSSGTETLYGYAYIDITPMTPLIRVIERFASPPTAGPGGSFALLPKLTFTTNTNV